MKCHIENEYCKASFLELIHNIHLSLDFNKLFSCIVSRTVQPLQNSYRGSQRRHWNQTDGKSSVSLHSLFEKCAGSLNDCNSYFAHWCAKITFENYLKKGESFLAPVLRWETVYPGRKCGSGRTSWSHFISSYDRSRDSWCGCSPCILLFSFLVTLRSRPMGWYKSPSGWIFPPQLNFYGNAFTVKLTMKIDSHNCHLKNGRNVNAWLLKAISLLLWL